MKETIKKIGKGIDTVLGVIINITFIIIFFTFMVTIISRYFLRKPVTWSYEVSVLAYMWTMFFGVGLGMKNEEHVVFGLVYDIVSAKTKYLFRMIYNIFLVFLLVVCFIPCCKSLVKSTMITGVLKMPYKVVFAPCIFMFVDIIVRSCVNISHAHAVYLVDCADEKSKKSAKEATV